MATDAIREMQRKQAAWHATKAAACLDEALVWRGKALRDGYIPEVCLHLSRAAVQRARKHNHVSLRYRRGELTV